MRHWRGGVGAAAAIVLGALTGAALVAGAEGVDQPAACMGDDMLLNAVRRLVPGLRGDLHKGQAGKIAVVGGSFEYTGAPYYAAVSSLKAGGDLAYIVCHEKAAVPIKTYSPEVIVLPALGGDDHEKGVALLDRSHALVVGPGLGRDPESLDAASDLIKKAKDRDIPIVLDGDALFLLTQDLSLVQDYRNAVLTPNVVEFGRLFKAMFDEDPPKYDFEAAVRGKASQARESGEIGLWADVGDSAVARLASALGHVTIVQKGEFDLISDGHKLVVSITQGSTRRCGGQGDVLAGTTGLFAHWALSSEFGKEGLAKDETLLLGALGASALTRTASRLAFGKHKRSMTTPNLMDELGEAAESLFPVAPSSL